MSGEVSTTHPDYVKVLPDWELVRDAFEGETAVKGKADAYLPMPSGFTVQEDGGAGMYRGYMLRAKFPGILAPTVRGMVGVIHRVAAEIELPPQMEYLIEKATADGLPLEALHERITTEILSAGRYGLLVDLPEEGTAGERLPYVAGYRAETIINWSSESDFFVLDETHLERDGFEWREVSQYRVLEKKLPPPPPEDGEAQPAPDPDDALASVPDGAYFQLVYKQGDSGQVARQDPVVPQLRGGRVLEEIPFVIAGSTDVAVSIDEIPLLDVARCAFNMYRLDADYKWQMFMSGQETLFYFTDSEKPIDIVGSGVNIGLPIGSDAKYVGPSGRTIQAHKEAILDERDQAVMAGARMFDSERKTAESGDALRIRFAAQTATLTTVAINSAKALEKALRNIALFLGLNPDLVSVKANLNFIDTKLDPQKAEHIMKLWMGGAISALTMWENFQRGDLATKDRTWDEEKELIDAEAPDVEPLPDPAQTGFGAPPALPRLGGQPPRLQAVPRETGE